MFGCESSLSLLAKEVLVTIVPCAKSFLSRKKFENGEKEEESKYRSRMLLHNNRRDKFQLTYNYPTLEWNWTRQVACRNEDSRGRKRASFWEYRKRSWDERWFACDPNDWRYPVANRNTLDDSLWNRDEVAWPVLPCHRVYRCS